MADNNKRYSAANMPKAVTCWRCNKTSAPEAWGWDQDHTFPEFGFFVRDGQTVTFYCKPTECSGRRKHSKPAGNDTTTTTKRAPRVPRIDRAAPRPTRPPLPQRQEKRFDAADDFGWRTA